ncbi:MAG TPA: DUF2304 domain-containing protein [Candidatus Solibacter sp.]|nr:DUF2304 domain-containing protein [Candidatus Solibacter sp.]
MIPAQPILVALLTVLVILYFARLRSRASDSLLVGLCFVLAALLIARPTVATKIANMMGIGRGVDLIFYLAIPGLALFVLILFARTRDLNSKLTVALREMALSNARVHNGGEPPRS